MVVKETRQEVVNFTVNWITCKSAFQISCALVAETPQKTVSVHCSGGLMMCKLRYLVTWHNSTPRWAHLRNHIQDLSCICTEPVQICRVFPSDPGFVQFLSLYTVVSTSWLCVLASLENLNMKFHLELIDMDTIQWCGCTCLWYHRTLS